MLPSKLKLLVIFGSFNIISGISNDICGIINGKRFYLENNESGSLIANQQNNFGENRRNGTSHVKCTVEFITCPSCIIEINFSFLNISRICGKASVYDTCGCDYVWIYEPPIEDASGEQFCGRFIRNNVSTLSYVSQTRTVAFAFTYSNPDYGHAFTLDYVSKRNRISIIGYPKFTNMNNASQYISSPFFPYLYPIDLSVEYVIKCEATEQCRISLLFTDFLVDESSIIEFFDSNGQRKYVISGNIFRPPTILSTGPSLVIRFYANGASDLGFKATYSFILGVLNELDFRPNMGCGGMVNNFGGGITMMHMVNEGTRLFDCYWIIKPSDTFFHRKTHLYLKIKAFSNFDCPGGLDFLCHNLRCISMLLNCDGFDHCGDNSDEPANCSQGPKRRNQFTKVPNFFFPKAETYYDITTATFVFLTCSFGLIGIILAMALLLYRVNIRARHQRQIQDHIETIHAILEQGVRDMDEEIILPDEPPVYEPPPEYSEILKSKYLKEFARSEPSSRRCSHCNLKLPHSNSEAIVTGNSQSHDHYASTTRSCQTTPMDDIPESPPPSYDKITFFALNIVGAATSIIGMNSYAENSRPGPSSCSRASVSEERQSYSANEESTSIASRCLENIPSYPAHILNELKKGFRSVNILKYAKPRQSCSEENLVRYFSDSHLVLTHTFSTDHGNRSNNMNLKKSFSTDDLSLL